MNQARWGGEVNGQKEKSERPIARWSTMYKPMLSELVRMRTHVRSAPSFPGLRLCAHGGLRGTHETQFTRVVVAHRRWRSWPMLRWSVPPRTARLHSDAGAKVCQKVDSAFAEHTSSGFWRRAMILRVWCPTLSSGAHKLTTLCGIFVPSPLWPTSASRTCGVAPAPCRGHCRQAHSSGHDGIATTLLERAGPTRVVDGIPTGQTRATDIEC